MEKISQMTGKQLKEYLDRFDKEELKEQAKMICSTLAKAAEDFAQVMEQLNKTYPEMFIVMGTTVSLSIKDDALGEYVCIKAGSRGPEDGDR